MLATGLAACAAAPRAPDPRDTAIPSPPQADALWRDFALEIEVDGLSADGAAKVHDAWRMATCLIRDARFWAAIDGLGGDPSPIVHGLGPGVALRQVAARQFLRWRQRHGPAARLLIHAYGSDRRVAGERAAASTQLGGATVHLRRWRADATIRDLAVTLAHEWLHTLEFADPARPRDPASVVYGVEAPALALIDAAACTEPLETTYIEAVPAPDAATCHFDPAIAGAFPRQAARTPRVRRAAPGRRTARRARGASAGICSVNRDAPWV